MAVEKFTISRDDSVYEAFPDLCLTDSGRVLLVYRESNGHVASEFCRLVVRSSDDAGRTWSERRVVVKRTGHPACSQRGTVRRSNSSRMVAWC